MKENFEHQSTSEQSSPEKEARLQELRERAEKLYEDFSRKF